MNSITIKNKIKEEIKQILSNYNYDGDILIEKPKDRSLGDYAIPCFTYSKVLHKSPNDIATLIYDSIDKNSYEKIDIVNGYLNIFLKREEIIPSLLEDVLNKKENYGTSTNNKTIVIDYSSPNIAKPFGIGHLRSTVIGNALKNICKKLGYNTISINYLGDWGTQFGKIIYAYNTWGNNQELNIENVQKLYVRFHQEAKENPKLEDEARKCFNELENGNKEYYELWQKLRTVSIEEFLKTYELLGIKDFDSYEGEQEANSHKDSVMNLLRSKDLIEEDDGALIVRLENSPIPAIVEKKDGSSIYMTREIGEIIHRKEKYNFDEIIYVVGNEQSMHFVELKEIIQKLGFNWHQDINHIGFGMYLQNGKKMATRQGSSTKLEDILLETINLAQKYIEEKNPNLENKEEISKTIGVGAVIFSDLKNYRTNDIEFNPYDILKFEGETGPYVQYTYARINTMLTSTTFDLKNSNYIETDTYIWNIINKILDFEEIIVNAKSNYDPSLIAKYILDLCQDFNKMYANKRIITDNLDETSFRLKVATATAVIIKEAMNLLGIKVPNKM